MLDNPMKRNFASSIPATRINILRKPEGLQNGMIPSITKTKDTAVKKSLHIKLSWDNIVVHAKFSADTLVDFQDISD